MARKLIANVNVMMTPELKRALLRLHLKELPQAEFSAWLRGRLTRIVDEAKK